MAWTVNENISIHEMGKMTKATGTYANVHDWRTVENDETDDDVNFDD